MNQGSSPVGVERITAMPLFLDFGVGADSEFSDIFSDGEAGSLSSSSPMDLL